MNLLSWNDLLKFQEQLYNIRKRLDDFSQEQADGMTILVHPEDLSQVMIFDTLHHHLNPYHRLLFGVSYKESHDAQRGMPLLIAG